MMTKFISHPISIGLERSSAGIRGACVEMRHKKPFVKELFTFHPEIDHVKRLYIHHPILTTALESKEVIVRSLPLPLTKEKDIEAALAFQAEPLLPYPIDQALLAYQITAKNPENTEITLFAARKESVQAHLALWQAFQIEPEKISCIPAALGQFGATYLAPYQAYLILHLQRQGMTCILMKKGKLWASFGQSEGLDTLLHAQAAEKLAALPQSQADWQNLEQRQNSLLTQAFKRLQKEVTKTSYALARELKGEAIEGITVTGEAVEWAGLSQALVQALPFPLLQCEATDGYTSQECLIHAVPIGLALGALPFASSPDFRQQEWSYPYPWQRLKKPLAVYFLGAFLLTLAFYFFSQQYLHYHEDQLRQTYLDLLSSMHKSHEEFEKTFQTKGAKASASFKQAIPCIEQMKQEELMERLTLLQKELQATPDSFPLFAHTPRVSDVLAWLSQHPSVTFLDEKGKRHTRLQIESFSYTMVKRPQIGKKQEKYQVKVELELSSPTPKWAREFHDALISPNDWVDPKGEVKWSSNRGKYKTSFFLKDKTLYPSS